MSDSGLKSLMFVANVRVQTSAGAPPSGPPPDAGGAVQPRLCVYACDVEQLPYVGFRPVGKVEGVFIPYSARASAQASPDTPYLPYRCQFECAPALCVVGNGAHRVVGRVALANDALILECARGRYSEADGMPMSRRTRLTSSRAECLCLCRGGVVVEGDEGLVDRVYLHIVHERCYGGHHARGYVAVRACGCPIARARPAFLQNSLYFEVTDLLVSARGLGLVRQRCYAAVVVSQHQYGHAAQARVENTLARHEEVVAVD